MFPIAKTLTGKAAQTPNVVQILAVAVGVTALAFRVNLVAAIPQVRSEEATVAEIQVAAADVEETDFSPVRPEVSKRQITWRRFDTSARTVQTSIDHINKLE